MGIATINNAVEEKMKFFAGSFNEDVALVGFGLAGRLRPHTWTLRVTEYYKRGEDGLMFLRFTGYQLFFDVKRGNTSFQGRFNFPSAGEMQSYDFGYGGAGFVKDVPGEILDAITEATGVDLSEARALETV